MLIKNILKKDVIRYQKELEDRTEMLKSNLSVFAHEQKVAISRIDMQRAEAIRIIYSNISRWIKLREEINFPKIDRGEMLVSETVDSYYSELDDKLFLCLENISTSITDNAILFTTETYAKIMDLCNLLTTHSWEIKNTINRAFANDKENLFASLKTEFKDINLVHHRELTEISNLLLEEFRRLMGVHKN